MVYITSKCCSSFGKQTLLVHKPHLMRFDDDDDDVQNNSIRMNFGRKRHNRINNILTCLLHLLYKL